MSTLEHILQVCVAVMGIAASVALILLFVLSAIYLWNYIRDIR